MSEINVKVTGPGQIAAKVTGGVGPQGPPGEVAGTAVAGVSSFNGKTGAVTLTIADLTAAAAVHTHAISQVTGLQSALDGKASVAATNVLRVTTLNGLSGAVTVNAGSGVTVNTQGSSITISAAAGGGGGGGAVDSVNGQTGVVVLTSLSVSAASAVHTHVVADITDLAYPVASVNGQTGTVVLTSESVSAASAVHTHLVADVTDFTNVANVVSVNGLTGVVTITAASQTVASVGSKSLTQTVDNYDAGTTDIVRLSGTADFTITGLSGGVEGVVRVLLNVGTHEVTIASQSPSSDAANRFILRGGDRVLRDSESLPFFYDATDSRWRAIAREPSAPAFLWTTVSSTATLNNYSAGTFTVLRLDASTPHEVSGFTRGRENAVLRLVNVGTNTITLVHNGTASDSQNRLLLDTGTNRSLDENDQAELLYDPVSLRWRVTPCCGSPTS